MADPRALEQLPMTLGYFRLILRCFGDTAERRVAILAGTRVSEADLVRPSAEISLFQQVRQVANVNAVHGEGWALSQPELWSPTAHGALGMAVLAAPSLGEGIEVLRKYAHVRAPFFRMRIEMRGRALHLVYALTTALEEAEWRPMMEITFVSIRALCEAVIGRPPGEAQFRFACAEPAHVARLKAALGENLVFGAGANTIVLPKAWAATPSAFADATLFRGAVTELHSALERLESPHDLRARVERLLHTMPDGRLDARAVAKALGVSMRTLTRRLAEAGTQFRDLIDAELRARAKAMMSAGTSRAEMAERLGYKDPTSLSRACRRWFGTKEPLR